MIEAVAVGSDVAAGLGLASKAGLRFFRPATAGTFGGTAACAKLAGLDEGTVAHAFGIALGQVSGTMQAHGEGSPLLGMQVGFGARNAIAAVDMARAGLAGTAGQHRGGARLSRAHGGRTRHPACADGAGPGLAYRRDGAQALAQRPRNPRCRRGAAGAPGGARHYGAGDVADVLLLVTPLVEQLVGREVQGELAVNQARLSVRWTTARILLGSDLGHEDFTPDALADRASQEFAGRVRVETDGNPDPNALAPVAVEIALKDGRRLARRVEDVPGGPARPLSREQHLAKFRGNWAWAGLDPQAGEATDRTSGPA